MLPIHLNSFHSVGQADDTETKVSGINFQVYLCVGSIQMVINIECEYSLLGGVLYRLKRSAPRAEA